MKYDENDRFKTFKDEKGSPLTEYEYTAAGRLKGIRSADGTGVSYGCDSDGNLYAYCGNDPVMYYDPNGHICKCTEGKQAEPDAIWTEGIEGGRDTASMQLSHYFGVCHFWA